MNDYNDHPKTRLSTEADLAEDIDAEFVKLAATEEARIIGEARRTALDEHTHMFRWLTASLLVLNGGGALAILSNESLAAASKFASGLFFVLGVILALLVGVAGQRSIRKALPHYAAIFGYWISVSHDGERVEAREQELNDGLLNSMRLGWLSQALGWGSGLMFVLGAGAVGYNLLGVDNAKTEEAALVEQTSTVNLPAS